MADQILLEFFADADQAKVIFDADGFDGGADFD